MNLYYAMGGGLGHLTRASAFLHYYELEKKTSILTLSEFAKDKRIVGDIDVVEISKRLVIKEEKYLEFVRELFSQNLYEEVFIDTFPFGIKREFAGFDFGDSKINYIARLMSWSKYLKFQPINTTIKFERSFILETLDKEHFNFIKQNSNEVYDLKLEYRKPAFSAADLEIISEVKQKNNFWLVVHSSDAEEILDLIYTADAQRRIEKKDVEIVVITPIDYPKIVENTSTFNLYPASVLFPYAERIFTACGFNIIQETTEFRHKHQFIPYHRAYDRQHLRAEIIRDGLNLKR